MVRLLIDHQPPRAGERVKQPNSISNRAEFIGADHLTPERSAEQRTSSWCRVRKVLDNCTQPTCPTVNALARCILRKKEKSGAEWKRGSVSAGSPAGREWCAERRLGVKRQNGYRKSLSNARASLRSAVSSPS